jgi:hypothetical protein
VTDLRYDPTVLCSGYVRDPFGDEDGYGRPCYAPCEQPSRYQVARSDHDPSFGINGGSDEACEEHLAQAVTGMISGDDVSAVVTIRWDPWD